MDDRQNHRLEAMGAPVVLPSAAQHTIAGSAVWPGAALAVATGVTLRAIGVAIASGMASHATSSMGLHDASVFTSIWSLVTVVGATFAGSLLTGWCARGRSTTHGAVEGLMAWGLALIAALFLAGPGAGVVASLVSLPGAAAAAATLHPAAFGGTDPMAGSGSLVERVAHVPATVALCLALVLSALAGVLGAVSSYDARMPWLLRRRATA